MKKRVSYLGDPYLIFGVQSGPENSLLLLRDLVERKKKNFTFKDIKFESETYPSYLSLSKLEALIP